MHKDFVSPVSIEEFAAYLDGNLTEDGMNDVSSAIHSDGSLQDIMSSCHTMDDTIANYEPLQLIVPDDISTNFEFPQIEFNDTILTYGQQIINDVESFDVFSNGYDGTLLLHPEGFDNGEIDSVDLLDF